MEFAAYQDEIRSTDQRPGTNESDLVVHLLGLAGEAGSVAAVYKKRMRDGDAYGAWRKEMRDELGDVLWYLSTIASKLGLRLDDVALSNLHKTQSRWLPSPNQQLDASAPESQRLPRRGVYTFNQSASSSGKMQVVVRMGDLQIGAPLTDNSLSDDGYRFHDIFHLAYATFLGWSPVTRGFLGRKRKYSAAIDEAEDGGRGIVTEEGVAAFAFAYGALHQHLEDVNRLDQTLLASIAMMTGNLEVSVRSSEDWERAILEGHRVFRELLANGGGSVAFDLDERSLVYSPPVEGAR